jgi:hypothetical protein
MERPNHNGCRTTKTSVRQAAREMLPASGYHVNEWVRGALNGGENKGVIVFSHPKRHRGRLS